jgi:hypothetical protein
MRILDTTTCTIAMIRKRILSAAFGLVVASIIAGGGSPVSTSMLSELAQDEIALKNAGIATDGQALLEYFTRRTPTAEQQALLQKRVAQLGSTAFPLRAQATEELIRAGRPALRYLRETARKSDPEIARRAQYCIGVIEQNTRLGLPAHAARVLVDRNPTGTLDALFAYLPFADEGWVEDEIRHAIKRIALLNGLAVDSIEQELTHPDAKRRGAAAWLFGASHDLRQRAKAAEKLRDEISEVRFLAASALLHAREPVAVPALIDLLTATPPELAWRAEDLLYRVAGERGPSVWLDATVDNSGRKVQAAWESWWKANGSKIDWKSLRLDEQAFGWTLIAENQRPDGSGRLYEANRAGEIRWQTRIQNPIDVQWIPGGRLLVADSRAGQIVEMDIHGSIGWKFTGISPTSVQRLPNGNTVASSYQKIVEINRDGGIVFSYATQGHTYHARKLPNNHYIWIDASGEISEIDNTGKLLAKAKISTSLAWGSIERLRSGRYLVALGGIGKVQEVDMTGKVFWERKVNNPNRAIRLANGNTVVASHGDGCVYEFDADGNERWKHSCAGRPFAALRR